MLMTSLRSMFTVNATKNKQRIKQLTNGYFIKINLPELDYQPQ